jgi:hypothetical protein
MGRNTANMQISLQKEGVANSYVDRQLDIFACEEAGIKMCRQRLPWKKATDTALV